MSEIFLNGFQIAMIKKAIAEGKRSLVTNDLLINIYEDHITVTNAHTGREMLIKNFKR
jgi:hypothetical protein